MTVQFLDPRAEPGMPVDPYELVIDLRSGPVEIGLLANGFPDSVNFLEEVEAALAAALPEARFHRYNKGNASIAAPDALLGEITAQCQAVVAAYGH
jgi:hypothetical protein